MRKLLASSLVLLALALPGTAVAGKPGHDSPLPKDYISNFLRGKDCPKWEGREWVFWNTYASGSVSETWTGAASATKLCGLAKQTQIKLTANIVTGIFFPELYSTAQNGRRVHLSGDVPKGWNCYRLPSTWALNAIDKGGPGAYGAAQGITAGAGYCEGGGGAKSAKNGKGKGKGKKKPKSAARRWFTWGPALNECIGLLKLAGKPDPAFPGSMIYPSYDEVKGANDVGGFYTRAPCNLEF